MVTQVTNINKPSGLTPVKYLNGADWTGGGNLYYIDSTDTNAYYPGDLVSPKAGLDQWSGIPTITLTVSGTNTIVQGVAIAFGASPTTSSSLRGGPYIDPTNLTLTSVPATKTKNYFALVVDDPNVVFEIQECAVGTTASTALSYTNATKNAYFLYAAPATGVYISGTTLDNGVNSGNTPATTAAAPYFLRMLGLSQRIDPATANYNFFGLYAKWLVKLNNHAFGPSVVGF
jgi:hypothetical protein